MTTSAATREALGSPWVIPVLAAALTVAIVAGESRIALLVWLLDGAVAVCILLAATLTGFAFLDLFRLGRISLAWRLLLGAGLGTGFLSLLTLGLGLLGGAGQQNRWIAPLVLLIGAVIGAYRLLRGAHPTPQPAPGARWWLLLGMAPFAALILLVAVTPPGLLWREEGNGYDVLEYHLQLPKEYYQAGHIAYLPHNVYANMPSAAEMAYLFCNLITGDPIGGWPVCKCLNALWALLFIAACGQTARWICPAASWWAGLIAASTGWLVVLSGVAYVENGLLLMGMLSLGALLNAGCEAHKPRQRRWIILAGVFAGLACGFKYTGLVLVWFPTAIAVVIAGDWSWWLGIKRAALYSLAALAAASPWLIKNTAMTGNPVFPLANRLFEADPPGWGPRQSAQFDTGHAPPPADATLAGRVNLLWRHVLADPDQRFGVSLFVLAAVAVATRRDRRVWAVGAMGCCQLLVWMLATHLYARFAVVLLIPLIVLAAVTVIGPVRRLMMAVILVGAAGNGAMTLRLYNQHLRPTGQRIRLEGAVRAFTDGDVPGFEYVGAINRNVPDSGRVLLVGDARPFYIRPPTDYCVVFNRSPFVECVETCSSLDDVMAFLRHRGYSHVLVHWAEIARLRATYGFSDWITPTLFDQLAEIGLQQVEVVRYATSGRAYAVLYRVTGTAQSDAGN